MCLIIHGFARFKAGQSEKFLACNNENAEFATPSHKFRTSYLPITQNRHSTLHGRISNDIPNPVYSLREKGWIFPHGVLLENKRIIGECKDCMEGIEKISRLVNWDDFSVFLAIYKTGSISKAAKLLGRTQPTISKRIEHLEARLGTPLFKRTTTGMVTTEIGQAMLVHAKAMNRSAASIEHMATGYDNDMSGEVYVQCLDGLVSDCIIPGLADFQDEHPGLNLSFYMQNTTSINPNYEPDLSVQFNTAKPMEHVASYLGTLHYVPMVSQAYRQRHGLPKNMQDVVNYHLMYLRRSGLVVENWEKKSRALRELATPSLSANNCGIILSAVLNGAGISMLPSYMAHLHPELIMLDYGIVYSYKFWLVRAPYTERLARVGKVADWLGRIFDSKDQPWFEREYVSPKEFSDIEIVRPR